MKKQGTPEWNEVKTNWLAFHERERERKRQTEKHAHAERLITIAKSVVTTFGVNFIRLAEVAFRKLRSNKIARLIWPL